MIIYDGALPSNVGGGGNVRNILRRVFAILHKNGWWDKLQLSGLLQIFEQHKIDLVGLYGEFKEYKSFDKIIEMEYERWIQTDATQKQKLDKLLKKNKQVLSIDDWIIGMTSWGIPADVIAQISGQQVPGNLYYEIATRQERITKAAEAVLYSTTHIQETDNIYFSDHRIRGFEAKILEIFMNVKDKNKRNIVILDRSAFYPTSGG